MSDNDPTAPKGAPLIGRAIVVFGWFLFAAAVGLIVVMVVEGAVRPGGVVLALLIAGCGAAALAIGNNVAHSRAGERPTGRG